MVAGSAVAIEAIAAVTQHHTRFILRATLNTGKNLIRGPAVSRAGVTLAFDDHPTWSKNGIKFLGRIRIRKQLGIGISAVSAGDLAATIRLHGAATFIVGTRGGRARVGK